MSWNGLLKDEGGQSLILATLCLTAVAAVLALAVDVGFLFHAKRTLQTAADSAAVAGAGELKYGGATSAAKAAAAQNGISDGVNGTVTVNNGPASGPHMGDTSYVEVIVSQPQPGYFRRIFTSSSVTVKARAVAHPATGQACMYTLDPTASSEFWITGTAGINMPGCAVYDDSNASNALRQTGTSSLTAAWIGVVGGFSQNGSGSVTPTPTTGIAPVPDPLAWLPEPSVQGNCSNNIQYSNGSHTLNAGCYSGIKISGANTNVVFNSGTYVINGSIDISGSGTITGNGVTIYVTGGGSTSIEGSGALTFTAPTSGQYNGVLLFQSRSNTSTVKVTGSSATVFKGIIYCSKAPLEFTGTAGETLYMDLIAATVKAAGTFSLYNYASVNPNAPIQRATIAE